MSVKRFRAPTALSTAAPCAFRLCGSGTPGRLQAEAFITDSFQRAYGAAVRHFMPELLCLEGEAGELQGVLGFRAANAHRLFLEQYFALPIEAVLAGRLQTDVTRASVMEVGNLATAHAGGARWLIVTLTAYLYGLGYQWAVFTAVPALANAFSRLGIRLTTLGDAEKQRLTIEEEGLLGQLL